MESSKNKYIGENCNSQFGYWTGFNRISGMEVEDEFLCVFEFRGRKPRELLVGVFIA